MKKRFVGGILLNVTDELLLVERSNEDHEMAGLWSLPAGGIEEGETDQQALEREFTEETGIKVECGRLITTVNRDNWSVNIYDTNKINGDVILGLDKDIATLSYFDLQNLPENLVLEARIGIIEYLYSSQIRIGSSYSNQAEGLFSSIYYSYLASGVEEYRLLENFEIYNSILSNTPLKKFKCCVPFLLSECNPSTKFECLLAEVLFCIWTLVDDVTDERMTKYETNTSLKNFSYRKNISSIYIAIKDIELFLVQLGQHDVADAVGKSLSKNAKAQASRFDRRKFDDIDDYLRESCERSSFLGESWSHALNKAGCIEEAQLVSKIYPKIALIAQLLNDYYDYKYSYKLEDLENHVITALSMLLYQEMLKKEEQAVFLECWMLKDRRQYIFLIETYNVSKLIEDRISEDIKKIVAIIDESDISSIKKDFLKYWIDLQFGKFINLMIFEDSYEDRLRKFSQIVDKLSQNIK